MNDEIFELSKTSFVLREKPFRIKFLHSNKSLASIQGIPNTEWYLTVSIIYDKEKYPNVKLLNNIITLKIKNKKEMGLKIKVLEEK